MHFGHVNRRIHPRGNRLFTVEEIASLRGFAGFFEDYEPVFLAKENVYMR